MFGFTQHTVHSLLLLPQILQDAMISLKLGGKSTAFLLHPIPLASWQMTRSTKMHWYLSFSKLVQLKPEFIRQSLVCSGKLVLLDKFFSSSAQRRRAQKELSGDNYTRKELEALLHQLEVI